MAVDNSRVKDDASEKVPKLENFKPSPKLQSESSGAETSEVSLTSDDQQHLKSDPIQILTKDDQSSSGDHKSSSGDSPENLTNTEHKQNLTTDSPESLTKKDHQETPGVDGKDDEKSGATVQQINLATTDLQEDLASTDDSPDSPINHEQLSVAQLIRQVEANKIKKQLQKKHKRELLQHMLRQKIEMHELRKQLKLAAKPFLDKESSGTKQVSSRNQSAVKDWQTSSPLQETDLDDARNSDVPEVPLTPELSPLMTGIPWSENDIDTRDLSCDLQDISLQSPLSTELPSVPRNRLHKRRGKFYKQGNRNDHFMPYNRFGDDYQKKHMYYPREEKPTGIKFNTHLFKTEICRSWTERKYCFYGDVCRFAHGEQELRVRPIIHKKYKTVRCKKFVAGYCPYGSRCTFVHSLNEKRLPVSPNSLARSRSDMRCAYESEAFEHQSFGYRDPNRRYNRRATTYN